MAVLLRSTRRYWRQMLGRATVNEYASSNERTKKATLRLKTKNKDVKIRTRSKKIRERGSATRDRTQTRLKHTDGRYQRNYGNDPKIRKEKKRKNLERKKERETEITGRRAN